MRYRVWPKDWVYLLDVQRRVPKFHREKPEGDQGEYADEVVSACGLRMWHPWVACSAVIIRRELAERFAEPCKRCYA